RYYNMRAFIVVGSMLVQLTYAIKKGWIKVRKIPSIISIWLAYVLYLVYFIRTEVGGFMRSDRGEIKTIMNSMKIFGAGKIYTWGGTASMRSRGCVSSPAGSYVLTYISAAWGLVIGLAVVMIVAALIVFGFVSMAKSKNQLGQIMGCGCMMWIAVNAIANIVVGFGIVPEFYASFFPFISNNNIVISYVFLGVLISVYKYKDAYPQHVDIKARSNKEKRLQSLKDN
ncbi:MAG: FtsW/RodA/SpoVE family cell cycle protein, partial [Butyrivibrio sp.]|nr:FtsW/RodA/SpoVE family cell cycle protein [Butyrivibrio sp.]